MDRKILVLENSSMVRELLDSPAFQVTSGWRFLLEADPKRYLERALEEQPDLILLSNAESAQDYPTVKGLKSKAPLAETPLLLLTSARERLDESKMVELGVAGFLRKPFQFETLEAQVRDLIAEKEARSGQGQLDEVEVVDDELIDLLRGQQERQERMGRPGGLEQVDMDALEEELDPTQKWVEARPLDETDDEPPRLETESPEPMAEGSLELEDPSDHWTEHEDGWDDEDEDLEFEEPEMGEFDSMSDSSEEEDLESIDDEEFQGDELDEFELDFDEAPQEVSEFDESLEPLEDEADDMLDDSFDFESPGQPAGTRVFALEVRAEELDEPGIANQPDQGSPRESLEVVFYGEEAPREPVPEEIESLDQFEEEALRPIERPDWDDDLDDSWEESFDEEELESFDDQAAAEEIAEAAGYNLDEPEDVAEDDWTDADYEGALEETEESAGLDLPDTSQFRSYDEVPDLSADGLAEDDLDEYDAFEEDADFEEDEDLEEIPTDELDFEEIPTDELDFEEPEDAFADLEEPAEPEEFEALDEDEGLEPEALEPIATDSFDELEEPEELEAFEDLEEPEEPAELEAFGELDQPSEAEEPAAADSFGASEEAAQPEELDAFDDLEEPEEPAELEAFEEPELDAFADLEEPPEPLELDDERPEFDTSQERDLEIEQEEVAFAEGAEDSGDAAETLEAQEPVSLEIEFEELPPLGEEEASPPLEFDEGEALYEQDVQLADPASAEGGLADAETGAAEGTEDDEFDEEWADLFGDSGDDAAASLQQMIALRQVTHAKYDLGDLDALEEDDAELDSQFGGDFALGADAETEEPSFEEAEEPALEPAGLEEEDLALEEDAFEELEEPSFGEPDLETEGLDDEDQSAPEDSFEELDQPAPMEEPTLEESFEEPEEPSFEEVEEPALESAELAEEDLALEEDALGELDEPDELEEDSFEELDQPAPLEEPTLEESFEEPEEPSFEEVEEPALESAELAEEDLALEEDAFDELDEPDELEESALEEDSFEELGQPAPLEEPTLEESFEEPEEPSFEEVEEPALESAELAEEDLALEEDAFEELDEPGELEESIDAFDDLEEPTEALASEDLDSFENDDLDEETQRGVGEALDELDEPDVEAPGEPGYRVEPLESPEDDGPLGGSELGYSTVPSEDTQEEGALSAFDDGGEVLFEVSPEVFGMDDFKMSDIEAPGLEEPEASAEPHEPETSEPTPEESPAAPDPFEAATAQDELDEAEPSFEEVDGFEEAESDLPSLESELEAEDTEEAFEDEAADFTEEELVEAAFEDVAEEETHFNAPGAEDELDQTVVFEDEVPEGEGAEWSSVDEESEPAPAGAKPGLPEVDEDASDQVQFLHRPDDFDQYPNEDQVMGGEPGEAQAEEEPAGPELSADEMMAAQMEAEDSLDEPAEATEAEPAEPELSADEMMAAQMEAEASDEEAPSAAEFEAPHLEADEPARLEEDPSAIEPADEDFEQETTGALAAQVDGEEEIRLEVSDQFSDQLGGMIEDMVHNTIRETLDDMLPEMMEKIVKEELEND